MTEVLKAVWGVVNSPLGIAVVAGLVLYLLNRLYVARPTWQRFEGAIISAVKHAEKQIPDDTPNKALAKLDAALRYVLSVFEDVEGRRAKPKEVADLKEGIQIIHADLEAGGGLDKAATPAEAGT